MSATLTVGPVVLNFAHRMVTQDDVRLPLTAAEFAVLETLVLAHGAAVSRDRLSRAALRRPWQYEDRGVDQLVFRLRRKLPADEHGKPLIQSIRGGGFSIPAGAGKGAGMSVVDEVAAERRRQVEEEGWSLEHDDAHVQGELARAAVGYASMAGLHGAGTTGGTTDTSRHPCPGVWPWVDGDGWKPKTMRRDLIRAGALLVAEIERLDRLPDASGPEGMQA